MLATLAACGSTGGTGTPSTPAADPSGTTSGDQATQPAAGGELYYLNFKPEIAPVYDEIAAAYEAETGVKLHVVTAASGTYEQTLKSEIAKADAPVLFQINGPKGYANWKDYCADLSGTELYQHLTDKGLAITDGDKVVGIPYVVEGYGIIYNNAIMEKYFALDGAKAKSMDEIRSFQKLKEVVEDMTAKKDQLGIKGVFASTSLKPGEDWRWQTHLANLPVHYEFEANNVDLSTDATKEITFQYGDNYKNIFDLYLNNSTVDPKLLGSKQVADSMAEFALGQCAMVQNGNWAWSQIAEVEGNTVKEEDTSLCRSISAWTARSPRESASAPKTSLQSTARLPPKSRSWQPTSSTGSIPPTRARISSPTSSALSPRSTPLPRMSARPTRSPGKSAPG